VIHTPLNKCSILVLEILHEHPLLAPARSLQTFVWWLGGKRSISWLWCSRRRQQQDSRSSLSSPHREEWSSTVPPSLAAIHARGSSSAAGRAEPALLRAGRNWSGRDETAGRERIIESLRLEKTSKIIKSNHQSTITTTPARRRRIQQRMRLPHMLGGCPTARVRGQGGEQGGDRPQRSTARQESISRARTGAGP